MKAIGSCVDNEYETLGARLEAKTKRKEQKRERRRRGGGGSIELSPDVSVWKFNPLVDANAQKIRRSTLG